VRFDIKRVLGEPRRTSAIRALKTNDFGIKWGRRILNKKGEGDVLERGRRS